MSNAIANIADQLTTTAAPAEKKAKAKKPAAKAKPAAKKESDAVAIVESLGIDTSGSKHTAIKLTGEYISEAGDKLAAANNIIKGLGGNEQSTELAADIVAKCLVERVIEQGAAFDSKNAQEYADKKLEKLMKKMPELKKAEAAEVPAVTPSGRANKNNNEKKAAALAIYTAMTSPDSERHSQSAIAKEIAAKLEITFANAFYYVNRVFK